jgi:prepilin-type N-terminal cleavage/methylation domain-containing protein
MHRRAFTMIEMTVVILILALLAASIMPNVVSALDSNRRRNYRLSVPRLAGEAHNYAVQRGVTVTMRTNTEDAFEIATTTDGEEQTIRTLQPVAGVEVDSLLAADGSDPGSDWMVNFYPDGTSDGAVIELSDSGAIYRYQVLKTSGKTRRIAEDDALEAEKWPAGDIAIRGGDGQ